jgi:ATP-dependent RNA helicase DDX5/DBP2
MEYLNDPVTVNIGDQNKLQANKAITQHIHMVKPMEKYDKLEELLESLTIEAAEKVRAVRDGGTGVVTAIDDTTAVAPPIPFNPKNVPKTLVFVGKKAECDDIAYDIRDAGYPVGTLHGDKTQDARSFIMQQFRHNSIKVLVATDVAARGLDITDIECVINFDFPPGKSAGIEDYVHRIGRTARGNRTGVAHSFFTPSDSHMAKDLVGILERSGQDVPEELRKMGNPRRMNSRGGGKGRSSGGNYGKAGGGGGKFGDNYDMIGGTRGKRDGGGERSFNPRSSGGASSYKGSGGYKGNGGGFRSGGRGDESGESDSFYRSGGFKVGNKKFGGGGGGQKSGSNNRGGGGAKKPKYKSIYDDDEYF